MSNLAQEIINGIKQEPRKELIDGIWYMSPGPSVNHAHVAFNIGAFFKSKFKGKPCRVFVDSLDVHLSENDIFVPDVMIVCNKDIIKPKGIYGAPDLIAEVLSPRSSRRDKIDKYNTYEKYGVKEYWIVDTKNKSIEVYWLEGGKYRLSNEYILYPQSEIDDMTDEEKATIVYEFKTSLFDDFTIDIREVFEDID